MECVRVWRLGLVATLFLTSLAGLGPSYGEVRAAEPDRRPQEDMGEKQDDKTINCQLDRILPELDFQAVAFNDAIDFLRDVSTSSIVVNWEGLKNAGVDKQSPVTVKLRNVKFRKALTKILDAVAGGSDKLDYRVEDGAIRIFAK